MEKLFKSFIALFLVLWMGIPTSSATEISQLNPVTIHVKDATVDQVFSAIEKQTGYSFFYEDTRVDPKKRVSLDVSNTPVNSVLNKVLDKGTSYKIVDRHIVLYANNGAKKSTSNASQTNSQQLISVSGTVTDENGEPIIGATVMTSDKAGTATDVNGGYKLSAKKGGTITFSYIGYVTQTLPVNKSVINVQLKPSSVSLDEVTVVAVGYGVSRKSDLTGAISSVSAKDFKKGVITTSEQLLQGKVAGLVVSQTGGDPSSSPSIRLRGGTSLSASNSPLIVVDGIPGVDLSTVQPSEIVSMDVLKDASATAIYGSRGANGVIIVTTNRENKGRRIEYNGYMGIAHSSKNLDVLSANEWRDYVRINNIADAVDYGSNTDWQKEVQRTGISQSHTVSFSNGSDTNGLRASLNYMHNNGIMKYSSLDRINGSMTAYQYGLNNKLRLELSLNATIDKMHNVNSGIYTQLYRMNPTAPVYDEDGNYTEQVGGYLTSGINPIESYKEPTSETTRKHFLGYAKAQYEIIDGLKATVNLSYEYNTNQGYSYSPSYTYKNTEGGYASRSVSDYTNKQIEVYLNYDKQFNERHNLSLMAGYSYLDYMYEGFGASRRKFDTDSFLWNNLGSGSDYRIDDVSSYKGDAKLVSFFGRANYNLDHKYFLTATVRRDGSSRFGENHKWGTFPSISAAWRISEESFMDNSHEWLQNLKLRVGYGVTGNQAGIGEYKSMMLMGTGGGVFYNSSLGEWIKSYKVNQNPNPDLKWESTAQTNIGLDLRLFNRLDVTLDWYYKKTSDLLYTYQVPTPPYLYSQILANVGDLTNKGIELTLGANIINTKNFSWDTNLTLAHNKQTINKLSNQVYQTDRVLSGYLQGVLGMSNVYSQIIAEGYPVGTFYGPHCEGIDENGNFILSNNGESQVLGNSQPKLTMGLSMNFTYRDFDLGFAGYGLFGQKVLNVAEMSRSFSTAMPSYNITHTFANSGIKEKMPVYSDYWLEDGSFFRLQSVTLGYNLPQKIVTKIGLSRLRVYATAENLFVINGYNGIDPEISVSGLSSPGIDFGGIYPMPRTFSFGLNISI